jgi:hypothetical protein
MPSVQTLVADIVAGNVVGIGAKPPPNDDNNHSLISGTCRIQHRFVHTKITFTAGNRVSFNSAVSDLTFHGSYIHFDADMSIAGNMDHNRPIAVSGNFSGCMWKIYRIQGGASFKCIHIPREAGVGADAFVHLCENYARQNNWTEIRSVGTNAVAMGGPLNFGEEILFVSQLFPNARIDTVRIKINNQGLIIQRDNWSDIL